MILRRIKSHVEKENWFAVGIDFAIVVVGVFIGIQVANWNEARVDRDREAQILREVATDLQADIFEYSRTLNYALDKISVLNHILETTQTMPTRSLADDYLDGGKVYREHLEESDELRLRGLSERLQLIQDQLWSRSINFVFARPSTTAFVSLETSGELGLLQNKGLVRQLQGYRQKTAGLQKTQDVTLRPARDRASETGHLYGLSLFNEVEEEALMELVSTTPMLTAVLQSQLGYGKVHFVNLSAASDLAERLLKQIEDELGEDIVFDMRESVTP